MTYQHSSECSLLSTTGLLPPWIAIRGWVPTIRCSAFRNAPFAPSLKSLFVLLLLCSQCSACAPGRGQYKRRAPRKLTPLVFKQYVPNVSEQTLGASGLAEGPVARKDERFSHLVPNYSEDVLFRDDEGTGADRLLTQRGKEKLDTLAISVMNQWPGVRLRVVEAWDEAKHHGKQSLHYEGRAVDITTSDRDRSKYGMLARLAVEAGFDWVFYESRTHVHCSVKSESLSRHHHGGCFSGQTKVRMADGTSRNMEDLRRGDQVSAVTESGEHVNSTVLLWLDRNPEEERLFFTLKTESGLTLSLTPGHLIYVLDAETAESGTYDLTKARATFARRTIIGDYLLRLNGSQVIADKLTSVEVSQKRGVYAPLTEHGTLVAGDAVASCYAQVQSHQLAHWAMLPARLSANFKYTFSHLAREIGIQSKARSDKVEPEPSSGVHWYAGLLYWLADWILPREWLFN